MHLANSSRGVVNDTCPLRTGVPFLCTSNPLILLLLDNAVEHGAQASLVALTVKNPPCNEGVLGSVPGPGRSPGGGHGNPVQYSCLENPHGQKSLAATVHGAAEGQTRLSTHAHSEDFVPILGSQYAFNAG